MITEKDILNAIESIRRKKISPPPERMLLLTPEQLDALRKLPVKTIPMNEGDRIFGVPFAVMNDMVPEHLFGDECRPAFIDEDYDAGDS